MVFQSSFFGKHLTCPPSTDGVFYSPNRKNNVPKKLTQNKIDFANALLEKGNATEAYFCAYPGFKGTRATAASNASRLLKEPAVAAYLDELRQAAASPTILRMQDIGEFLTQVVQQEDAKLSDRLSAARTLATYVSKKVFDNSSANETPAPADTPQLPDDFAAFCMAHGYPRPYPKQKQMALFVLANGPRLLLGSRGYGKTDYAVICAVAWDLLKNPAGTWLIVTKEKERGKDILCEIARLLTESGKQLVRNNSQLLTLSGHTGKDPNVAVLPLRSKSFRGRHPGHIICDDMITPDDVSKAERAKVEAVLAELMKLTQNVVLIGQPAHAKDIYAKMRKLDGVKKMEVPYGQIPQLDHNLEAQRAAGISEASIQASYFLKISESERMPFAQLEFANFFPSGTCAGFIDPSHEGNDYTAFAMTARNFDQLVIAGFAWQKAWDDCLEEIVAAMKAFNCVCFAFETNGVGKHPLMVLKEAGANVEGWKSTTNKHARIMNAAAYRQILKLCTFLPPDLNTPAFKEAQTAFNNMVVDYEYKAEHDDAPDALANLLMYIGVLTDEHKRTV